MAMKVTTRHRRGFTLVELLVVLAVIGLLAGIATPMVMKHLSRSKSKIVEIEIKNISVSLMMFKMDNGRYPTEVEGLEALRTKPDTVETWQGPYLDKTTALNDPWGNKYTYKPIDDEQFIITSYGADNREGGTGEAADISNKR